MEPVQPGAPNRRVGVENKWREGKYYNFAKRVPMRRYLSTTLGPTTQTTTLRVEPFDKHEKYMKVKILRLIYHTVKDSDLKIKRAENIQKRYRSARPEFNFGYLVGIARDKNELMIEIHKTKVKNYVEWTPDEHINAYQQIAQNANDIDEIIEKLKQSQASFQ